MSAYQKKEAPEIPTFAELQQMGFDLQPYLDYSEILNPKYVTFAHTALIQLLLESEKSPKFARALMSKFRTPSLYSKRFFLLGGFTAEAFAKNFVANNPLMTYYANTDQSVASLSWIAVYSYRNIFNAVTQTLRHDFEVIQVLAKMSRPVQSLGDKTEFLLMHYFSHAFAQTLITRYAMFSLSLLENKETAKHAEYFIVAGAALLLGISHIEFPYSDRTLHVHFFDKFALDLNAMIVRANALHGIDLTLLFHHESIKDDSVFGSYNHSSIVVQALQLAVKFLKKAIENEPDLTPMDDYPGKTAVMPEKYSLNHTPFDIEFAYDSLYSIPKSSEYFNRIVVVAHKSSANTVVGKYTSEVLGVANSVLQQARRMNLVPTRKSDEDSF